jgi:hypothetical protein
LVIHKYYFFDERYPGASPEPEPFLGKNHHFYAKMDFRLHILPHFLLGNAPSVYCNILLIYGKTNTSSDDKGNHINTIGFS